MKSLFKNIKITRTKLFIAKLIYYGVKVFFWKNKQLVNRQGINFELDLNEGIDLSLFVFGNFQKHIYQNEILNFENDSVIFDVGGNTGTMSLLFAKKSPQGVVHAFEPTNYAFAKFVRNLELNPELDKRIKLTQCFVSSESKNDHNIEAFSSWPINTKDKTHSIHCGVAKPANDVPAITLDKYCEDAKIDRLDIIKIDTDGHEMQVLQGAKKTFRRLKPRVIFEVGIYIMDERNVAFSDYYNYFRELGYVLKNTKGKDVDLDNFANYIPQWGTTDLIAVPEK